MEKHVTLLIEKIRESALNSNKSQKTGQIESADDEIPDMEGSEEKPMHIWFGLDPALFPSSEQLSDDQIELLTGELYRLWEAYHFWPDFPELLPQRRRYELMVRKLQAEVEYWPVGTWFIEFCEYDPENCPFGEEYCWCKTEGA